MIQRVRAFGLFWWDFLVGDARELALGAILILGIAFAVHRSELMAALIIPAAVVLLLCVSAWRGRGR